MAYRISEQQSEVFFNNARWRRAFLALLTSWGINAFAQEVCSVTGPFDACTGVYRYFDGSTYEGTFSSNTAHGSGSYRFSSGAIYQGEFKNNELHGRGQYTFKSGEIYIGEFESSKRHGYGVLVTRNGSTFSGFWSNDNLVREIKVSQRISLETKPSVVVATLRAIDNLQGFTSPTLNAFEKFIASNLENYKPEQSIRFLDLDNFNRQVNDAIKNSEPQIRISFLEKFSPSQMPKRIKRLLSDIDSSGGNISVQIDVQTMLATRSLSDTSSIQASSRTRGILNEMLNPVKGEANVIASPSTSTPIRLDLQSYAKQFATKLYQQIPAKSFVALKISAPKEIARSQSIFEHVEGVVAAQLLEASQFGARISPRASLQTIWKEKEIFSDLDVEEIESFLGKIEADYFIHIHLVPGRDETTLTGRAYSLYGLDKGLMVFALTPTAVAWNPFIAVSAQAENIFTLSNYNAVLYITPGLQNNVSVSYIMLQRRSP